MKVCYSCKIQKEDGEFYPLRRRGRIELQAKCKICSKAHQRQWVRDNPDFVSDSNKRNRANNWQTVRQSNRNFYVKNPTYRADRRAYNVKKNTESPSNINSRVCSKCKTERDISRFAKAPWEASGYKSSCYDCAIITDARRRAGYKNGEFTLKQWESKKKEYNQKCAYCFHRKKKLCKDHVVPVSKGGSGCIDNIVPCCRRCNSSKGDREVLTWLKEKFPNHPWLPGNET